jgi:hypothetical protein
MKTSIGEHPWQRTDHRQSDKGAVQSTSSMKRVWMRGAVGTASEVRTPVAGEKAR